MSRYDPTLAEFLDGCEILVPQNEGAYLVGYSYHAQTRRFVLRDTRDGSLHTSKKLYSIADVIEVYNKFTPKRKGCV
jgi:hypothetical protein